MSGPIDIQPPPREWIAMRFINALWDGTVVVRNPTLESGGFSGDYPTREHYYGTVHNRQIYPSMSQTISAYATESYHGTSGTITLYEGSTSICTLFWDCPGSGGYNVLREYDVDSNYWISIGDFNASGPIGDVNITIQRASIQCA